MRRKLIAEIADRIVDLRLDHPLRVGISGITASGKTTLAIARNRGALREALSFGSYEKAEALFVNRYHAASQLYIEEHAPLLCADIIVNNNDTSNPYIVA